MSRCLPSRLFKVGKGIPPSSEQMDPVPEAKFEACQNCRHLLRDQLIYMPIHTTVEMLTQMSPTCLVCLVILTGLSNMVEKLVPSAAVSICPGHFGRPIDVLYSDDGQTEGSLLQFFAVKGTFLQIYRPACCASLVHLLDSNWSLCASESMSCNQSLQ